MARKRLLLGIIAFWWFSACQGEEDFNSRLNLILSSFPPSVSSAGMGGVWVASPYPVSHNPACLARMADYKIKKNILYSGLSQISFGQGPETRVLVNSIVFRFEGGHFFRLASFKGDSEREKIKQGLETELEIDIVELAYAFRVSPDFSFGVSFCPSRDIEVNSELNDVRFLESESESNFSGKIGFLYSPIENLFVGATLEHTREKVKSRVLNPFFFRYFQTTEKYRSYLLRVGFSWRPWRGSLFAVDRQFGEIKGLNKNEDAGKWFLGFEQAITKNPIILLRVGSLDRAPTWGIGLYYKNRIFLDYAYINQANRDLEPFFGNSDIHMISLSVAF